MEFIAQLMFTVLGPILIGAGAGQAIYKKPTPEGGQRPLWQAIAAGVAVFVILWFVFSLAANAVL